jgi:hypothetical protein
MNRDTRDRWVAALRSGDYAQGRRLLRSFNDYFCSIGVLCDVVDPAGWSGHGAGWSRGHGGYRYRGAGFRPEQALFSVGLTLSVAGYLLRMNDEMGLSFAQIADWIETKLTCDPPKNWRPLPSL